MVLKLRITECPAVAFMKSSVMGSIREKSQEVFPSAGGSISAKRFSSTEKAIREMKLEYLGEVTRDGKTYHRIRSWAGRILTNSAYAVSHWLIDARRCCRRSSRIRPTATSFPTLVNEPIPLETFQAPAVAGVPLEPFKLEEGYDHFFL